MQPLNAAEPRWAGRYRLLASLGEGGMGRVLLALSPDGRLAALKQIHPGLAHDDGFRRRFHHEVDASRSVSGAYTAAVLGADPGAPTPWLASLYVPGPSLREAVDTAGPLPEDAIRLLAVGLATALADIHRAGLIHRDLKPTNVLLAADGPRVIDFGIARAAEGDSELTRSGAVIGSPGFMSPEQARGERLTPASDLFSLGALLVMAATGQSPFAGLSTPQTLYNVVHTRPDLSTVPPAVRRLAEPCLAKDPTQRPTPGQLLDLLGPVLPSPRPWPAAVHELIDRQDAEAAAAVRGASERGRNPLKVATATLAAAAAGGGAILATTMFGLTDTEAGTALPGSTTAPPSRTNTDPLSTERLRGVDPCRVLSGDLETTIDVHFFSCTYEAPDGRWFELTIGDHVASGAVGAGTVAGLPATVDDPQARDSCEAAVAVPGEPALALSMAVSPGTGDGNGGKPCESAKHRLGEAVEAIRDGGGRRQGPQATLATVDPCALLRENELRRIFGTVPVSEPDGLHGCEWAVTGTVDVTLERAVPPDKTGREAKRVRLAGTTAYQEASPDAGSPSCVVRWTHLPGEDAFDEVAGVRYRATGSGLPVADMCRKTRAVAETIVPRLPRR